MSRRVVISGLGAVAPRAVGHQALWQLLFETTAATAEPLAGAAIERAGGHPLRHADRLSRLALAATALAIEDSIPAQEGSDPYRTGIAFGSGFGCLPTNVEYLEGILERGSRYGNPVVFQNTVPNAVTGYVSMVHAIRGPTATLCSGWAAGLEALDWACRQIEEGRAERMIAASADSLSAPLIRGLSDHGWLSSSSRARPFDLRRDGLQVNEGACTLVLEELDEVRDRGGLIYAELVGIGHQSGPVERSPRALARAVRAAMREAEVEPGQIDAVFAGANGHREFDRWEADGLSEALGARASAVPVVCPKGVLGEAFGASGAFAALLAARSLDSGWVPATWVDFEPDPECQLNVLTGAPRHLAPQWALVTSLGDEGSALAAVLRRYQT